MCAITAQVKNPAYNFMNIKADVLSETFSMG